MSLQDFYPWFVIFSSSLAASFLFNIWHQATSKGVGAGKTSNTRKDLGVLYLALGILSYGFLGVIYLYFGFTLLDSRASMDIHFNLYLISISSLNNVFFLLAIPYLKYAPDLLATRFPPPKWQRLTIGTGAIGIVYVFIIGWLVSDPHQDSLWKAVGYYDFGFSIITLVLLGFTITKTFFNRNLYLVSALSAACFLVFIGFQLYTHLLLSMEENAIPAIINAYCIVRYFSLFALITILFAIGTSWLLEEVSHPEGLEVHFISILNDRGSIEWKFPGKEYNINVLHNPTQTAFLLVFAKVQVEGKPWQEGKVRNWVELGDIAAVSANRNITKLKIKVVEEINKALSLTLNKISEKDQIGLADIFGKLQDQHWLRTIDSNGITINKEDQGIRYVWNKI